MSSSYGRQTTHLEPQILSRDDQHPAQGRVVALDAGSSQVPHDGAYPSGLIDDHATGHEDDNGRKRQRRDDDKGAQIVSRLKRVHLGNPNHHVDQTNTMYIVVNRMLKEAHEDMMRRKYESH